jgi:hypothetical protein
VLERYPAALEGGYLAAVRLVEIPDAHYVVTPTT